MRREAIRPIPKEKDFVEFFGELLRLPFDVVVGMVPVLGEVVDAVEAITGVTKWGKKLSTTERAVVALGPVAIRLVNLDPYPTQGKSIRRNEYRARVSIEEKAAAGDRAAS